MKKYWIVLVVSCIAAGGGIRLFPGVRVAVASKVEALTSWTEDARRQNPEGYVDHVREQLKDDIAAMRDARGKLRNQMALLSEQYQELAEKRQFAETQAREFRRLYHAGTFPVVHLSAIYDDEASVERQVAQLLAELDGHATSLDGVGRLKAEAEDKLRELTVQINSSESELAMLGVKRELLATRALANEGKEMLSHVDALLNQNQQVITQDYARSIEELAAAAAQVPTSRVADDTRLNRFLDLGTKRHKPQSSPVATGKRESGETSVDSKPLGKSRKKKDSDQPPIPAPVFQQST